MNPVLVARAILLVSVLLCGGASALAQSATSTLPAGFAPGTLWISKSSLVAGDSAVFYTVVYNSSASTIAGDTVFSVDGIQIGTQHFSLSAGATQVLSVPWTASAGTHTVNAVIENTSGDSAPLEGATSSALSIAVASPPPPSATVAAVNSMLSGATAAAPVVASAASGALSAVDSARQQAITAIQNTLANSDPATGTGLAPTVLGTSTERVAATSADTSNDWKSLGASTGSIGSVLHGVWTGALHVVLVIFQSDILFWLFLIVILYVLYRLLRLVLSERRRSKE